MCVYTITHRVSGRVYVGQTTGKAKDRWIRHTYKKTACRSAVRSAIHKYGHEEFMFDVIDIAESQEQLDHKERLWIRGLNTVAPHGFNLAHGGNGVGKHTEATKRLIGAAHKGRKDSEAVRKVKAEASIGRVAGPETREKLRAANLGKVIPQEVRDKISRALMGRIGATLGYKRTPEQCAASSARLKGRVAPNKGLRMSESQKMRQSLARRGKPSQCNVKPVIRSDGVVFGKMKDAAAAIGAHRSSILDVIKGRRNSVHGFTFKYAGEQKLQHS